MTTLPVDRRKKACPHSAAEQQLASAGKSRKTSAIKPMTIPAAKAPMRKSGVRNPRIRPEMQKVRRMALQVARVAQGSQRRKAAFIMMALG